MNFADDLNSVAKTPQQVASEEKKRAVELGETYAKMDYTTIKDKFKSMASSGQYRVVNGKKYIEFEFENGRFVGLFKVKDAMHAEKQLFGYKETSEISFIPTNYDEFSAYLSALDSYHVTEACVLTKSNHPVSFFSEIHSSKEKSFISTNDVTFSAMERGSAMFGRATFVMDRGYDDNKMFLKLDELKQDYVIRLTAKRKLFFHGKWVPATQLRNQRKGKIKTPLMYKGKRHDAYLSHVKVQITASRKDIYLVLVYGITEHPMMLATNKEIKSKEEVIKVAKTYFSRWRIEEYFRCKKQMFQLENFRVRKLAAINALNFYITLCMAFLAHISMKSETNALKVSIIQTADPIKEKVHFCYYRLAKGISGILSYAKEGVRLWFRTKRPAYRQLCLKLAV